MAEIQFNAARSKPGGLDVCAGPIALGRLDKPGFDRNGWPIMCNTHSSRPEILARIEEIKRDLDSGKYSPEDLEKMHTGVLWIGAPTEAVVFVLGLPRNVQKSTTKDGIEEVWFYRNPLDGSAKVITFVNGTASRIDEG
ncbi:MAG: hypothetical protein IPP82_15400 [Xanthomonadales bacterium]|nr:hypothetical protein [Xanthomonadales bacterium]